MATVLWGARRGDVVYGGRDWRRRNIPIGVDRVMVASPSYFDVGQVVDLWGSKAKKTLLVVGMEGNELGVRLLERAAYPNGIFPFVLYRPGAHA